ncbi:MAG: carbohydrate kinase family protein [bacterium]
MNIVVTGSIAFDYLMSFPGNFSEHFLPDKLDRISVSFLVDSMKKRNGGVGANIAYNLALLGERPFLFSVVGKDFGSYRDDLERAGIDVSGIRECSEEYTASCFVSTDRSENQIVSFYTGAMRFAKDFSLKDLNLKETDLVLVSPNDPEAIKKYAAECREMSVPYIFDPGQQTVCLTGEELLDGADGAEMFILNEYELEMFRNKTGLDEEAVQGLAEIFVVTLGKRGSEIRTRQGTVHIPAVGPDRVLDPTGVGDAYRAGLVKGMAHHLSWETAGRMGSLAAAYVLETDGPQSHAYDLEMFVARYCSVFGESKEMRRLVTG